MHNEKIPKNSGFNFSELVARPGEQNINRAIFDIELTISQSGHRNMQGKTRTSTIFPLYPRTIVRCCSFFNQSQHSFAIAE